MTLPANISALTASLGNLDPILLHQVLKGNIPVEVPILVGGCGAGRNCRFFISSGYSIYGIDRDERAIQTLRTQIPTWNPGYPASRFLTGPIENMPFEVGQFGVIFLVAVLHFAETDTQLRQILEECRRVLIPSGLFICRFYTDCESPFPRRKADLNIRPVPISTWEDLVHSLGFIAYESPSLYHKPHEWPVYSSFLQSPA